MEFSGINFMILLFVCCCYKYVYFVWIWKSKQIWKESKQIFCLPTFDVHKQWIFRTFFTLNCLMLPMLTSVHCKGLKLAEGLKINEFLTKFPIIVNKNSSFLGWGTRFCCDAKSALLTLYILKYRISPSVRPVCVCAVRCKGSWCVLAWKFEAGGQSRRAVASRQLPPASKRPIFCAQRLEISLENR